jgi:hypothetical protein
MKDVKFLAIFIGVIVDIVGSFTSGLVLGIILIIYHVAQGTPLKDISSVMDQKHLSQSIPFLLSSLGLGGFFSLVGGFVAGWMAKVSPTKNGLIMGVISTLLSIFFWSFSPAWFNAAGCLFTIGPATAGGYLAFVFFGRRPPANGLNAGSG